MYWEMTEDPREVRVFFSGSFFVFLCVGPVYARSRRKKDKKTMQKSEKNILAKVRRSKEKRIFRGFNLFFWLFLLFFSPKPRTQIEEVKPGVGPKNSKIQKQETRNQFLGFSFFFFNFLHF